MNRVHKGMIRNELALLILTQALVAILTITVLMLPRVQGQVAERSRDAERLNQLALDFHQKYDRWPQRNGGVWELATTGFIDYRTDRSDYQRMCERFSWNKKTSRFEAK